MTDKRKPIAKVFLWIALFIALFIAYNLNIKHRMKKFTHLSKGTKYPIVFVPGLWSIDKVLIEDYKIYDYFAGTVEYLNANGYDAKTSETIGADSIENRAMKLKEFILKNYKTKVNIIAHSMGGLDARYMVSQLGMASSVATITTISTPHRGSSFADWGLEHFGEKLKGIEILEAIGFKTKAYKELTTKYMTEVFNPLTPDVPSVQYYSYAGNQDPKFIFPSLLVPYKVILDREGPNDGLVSVRSAKWGNFKGTIDADHLDERGWLTTFDAKKFYESIAKDLKLEGY
jgi:triacylglycerol lipase